MEGDKKQQQEEQHTTLRFVQINDVYELDNLPRFATALKEVRQFLRLIVLSSMYISEKNLSMHTRQESKQQ